MAKAFLRGGWLSAKKAVDAESGNAYIVKTI